MAANFLIFEFIATFAAYAYAVMGEAFMEAIANDDSMALDCLIGCC